MRRFAGAQYTIPENYLKNPFRHGRELIDGRTQAANAAKQLDAGDIASAEAILLGTLAAIECRDIRPADFQVEDAQLRQLPYPPSAYRRLAQAAGRAFRAISKLRGRSQVMERVRADIWAACFGDSLLTALNLYPIIRDHDVLVLGETGTGKDLVASAIQQATLSNTPEPPSATLNAAALPSTLVESELFGYVKGAFTGAATSRQGRLLKADGGVFFLDEVGDLPVTTQVKLLRVIENDEFYALGADKPAQADIRYVAATHKRLDEMADRGEFRRDLFERLAGLVIRLPPLRNRPADIEDIGMSFLDSVEGCDAPMRDRIQKWLCSDAAGQYHWPGNVRELQNVLRSLLLGLTPEKQLSATQPGPVPSYITKGDASLAQVEAWYIDHQVALSGGNLTKAAHVLEIDRSTLRRKLRRTKTGS